MKIIELIFYLVLNDLNNFKNYINEKTTHLLYWQKMLSTYQKYVIS